MGTGVRRYLLLQQINELPRVELGCLQGFDPYLPQSYQHFPSDPII